MTPISTRDLSRLPAPADLERVMQSLAMLEAVVEPDWDSRYYSFYPAWADDERMGWRRDRSRLELFALFSAAGCFIKGYDPCAALAHVDPDQFYRQVPGEFAVGVGEVAFTPEDVTFCCWRSHSDRAWQAASVPAYSGLRDGSETLLDPLDGDPGTYVRFLTRRYGDAPDAAAVAAVYAHCPLTVELANALGRVGDWDDVVGDAREIGYAVG